MSNRRRLHLVSGNIDTRSESTGPSRGEAILPLELIDVAYRAGREELLSGINLSFDGNLPSVILGPNGAGKTLLLRICHGLLEPSSGFVRWRDPSLAMRPDSQGMVFQKPVMLRRSVSDNVRFALKVTGVERKLHGERTTVALDAAGLSALADRRATHLSGGEQQRLALARCHAIRPRVLFLDEPTAHLDPTATRKIEDMIAVIRDAGTRIIMVTHDVGQAKRLAGHIVFMHRGRVLESTAAEDFFGQPSSSEAAAYLDGELLW